jgi:predicted DNA-binding transcriptional regulator AlpA
VRGQRIPPVGLHAQASVNGTAVAPTVPRTSGARPGDLPHHLPRRLLPVKAAATYLGVSVRSVWRLVDAGHVHPVRLPSVRRVAFDVRELDVLIEASRD